MRASTAIRRGAVVVIASSLAMSGDATADPGDLDPTFGGDGLVEIPSPPIEHHGLRFGALALAPQNGVWLAATDMDARSAADPTVVITRMRADGSLSTEFGDEGQVVWQYRDDGVAPGTLATGVDALPGGGVQIAGEWSSDTWTGPGPSRSYVARFDENGDLVDGFGKDGAVSAGKGAFEMVSIAEDLSFYGCEHLNKRVIVRRYSADGRPDTEFGGDGTVSVHIPDRVAYRRLVGCSAANGGGVLLATISQPPVTLRIKKRTSTGEADHAYGRRGTAAFSVSSKTSILSSVFAPDGGAHFAGVRQVEDATYPAVLAVTADGHLDTTYGGGDGLAVLELEGLRESNPAPIPSLMADGSVSLAGSVGFGSANRPFVARLNSDGELDETFGDGGAVVGYLEAMNAVDVVVDGTGRIVTANEPDLPGPPLVVARFKR